MRNPLVLTALIGVIALPPLAPAPAYAVSEAECAIWLCLPGGFPTGCSAAYSAFKKRIKKKKPPLPALRSCVVGSPTDGRYQQGYEPYELCRDGYVTINDGRSGQRQCVPNDCRPVYIASSPHYGSCQGAYMAPQRPKPHFIQMWTNDGTGEQYLGKFFY